MFSICIKSKNPWSNSSWSYYPGGLSVKGTVGTHWSFDRFSTIFDMVTQETLLSYCEPWNMLFMLVWPWCWNRFTLSKNMQLKDIRYTKMKLKVDQLSKGFFFFFFPFLFAMFLPIWHEEWSPIPHTLSVVVVVVCHLAPPWIATVVCLLPKRAQLTEVETKASSCYQAISLQLYIQSISLS